MGVVFFHPTSERPRPGVVRRSPTMPVLTSSAGKMASKDSGSARVRSVVWMRVPRLDARSFQEPGPQRSWSKRAAMERLYLRRAADFSGPDEDFSRVDHACRASVMRRSAGVRERRGTREQVGGSGAPH